MDAQAIGIPGKWKASMTGRTIEELSSNINTYFGFGQDESLLIQVFDDEFSEYVVFI